MGGFLFYKTMMTKELEDVLSSKKLVRGKKVYESPADYLNPIISEMLPHTKELSVKSVIANVNISPEDEEENVAYKKVLVNFKTNEGDESDYYSNILYIFDLSKREPQFIIANGMTVRACTNGCIWTDGMKYTFNNIKDIIPIVKTFSTSIKEKNKQFVDWRDKLTNKKLDREQFEKLLGKVLTSSSKLKGFDKKVIQESVLFASDVVQNESKEYKSYYQPDFKISHWQAFNSMTQHFTNLHESNKLIDYTSPTLELSKIYDKV